MPLIVFILVALVCFVLLGFACACLGDHPMHTLAQAHAAMLLLPAIVEIWPVLVAALLAAVAFAVTRRLTAPAPSAASLQRFLL